MVVCGGVLKKKVESGGGVIRKFFVTLQIIFCVRN